MAEWEAEHGAFTASEPAAARPEMTAADHEHVQARNDTAQVRCAATAGA